MYTCLFEQSFDGTPAIRDLVYDFHEDPNVYGLKGSFLWGRFVKVTVNIDTSKPNNGTFNAYFPAGKWYDYEGHSQFVSTGMNVSLKSGYDYTHVHFKQGSIIPVQDSSIANDTNDLLFQPMRYIVFATPSGTAEGSVFLANGMHEGEIIQYFKLRYSERTIRFDFQYVWGTQRDNGSHPNYEIESIKIVDDTLKNADFYCAVDINQQQFPVVVKSEV